MWHKEDSLEAVGFGWDTELYFLGADGRLWLNGNTRTVPEDAAPEGAVESMAEFADFTEGDANKKGTAKLQVRMELDAGASVKIEMQFDSDGAWREVTCLSSPAEATTSASAFPAPAGGGSIPWCGRAIPAASSRAGRGGNKKGEPYGEKQIYL